jgi:hypothetical protein
MTASCPQAVNDDRLDLRRYEQAGLVIATISRCLQLQRSPINRSKRTARKALFLSMR